MRVYHKKCVLLPIGVWTTMLIMVMSAKYRNCMHVSLCIAIEVNATELVMCTVLIVVMSLKCCNSM